MTLYEYLNINAKHLLDYWDNDLNLIDIKEIPHDYPEIINWKCEKGHTWTLTIEKALKHKDVFCKQCYWEKVKENKERNRKKYNYLERQRDKYKIRAINE